MDSDGLESLPGKLRLPERTPTRRKRILESHEAQCLVSVLKPPYGAVVSLALFAGLREGEIATLQWNDIGPAHFEVDEAVYCGK